MWAKRKKAWSWEEGKVRPAATQQEDRKSTHSRNRRCFALHRGVFAVTCDFEKPRRADVFAPQSVGNHSWPRVGGAMPRKAVYFCTSLRC
jgi:hypothetical protein